MKNYYDLLKDNLIDFNKALLDYYNLIGLDETECLVLLRLHDLIVSNSNVLDSEKIVKRLSISGERFTEIIGGLVNRNFVELKLELDDSQIYTEKFFIDGTFRQLGYVFESQETKEESNIISIEMKKTMQYLEKKLAKMLTPVEVSIVKKWFYDYKYSNEMINEEIEKVIKRKVKSVSIIDRALFARTKEVLDDEDVNKAKDLFEKLYG